MKSAEGLRTTAIAPVPPVRDRLRTWIVRTLAVGVVVGLLFFALREAPVVAIWEVVRRLQVWQIGVLLGIDAIVYAFVSARWWLIVRAEDSTIEYVPLIGVRLAAFAVSYFTVGPQVGGEPLQVLYLRRRYGTTYARATASVIIDKLLELLANFVFLILGIGAALQSGVVRGGGGLAPWNLIALLVFLAWPLFHILMLISGRHPISALLGVIRVVRQDGRPARYLRASERLAGQFCRRHTRTLFAAAGASLLACAAAVIEYGFITSFLAVGLSVPQIVVAWTAGWLSFLVPVPGGLGALEAVQVLALGAFGVSQAAAMGVAVAMRGRDLLLAGIGAVLGGRLAAAGKSKPHPADVFLSVEAPAQTAPGAANPEDSREETND